MSDGMLVPIVIGGGVLAYALAENTPAPIPTALAPNGGQLVGSGASPGSTVGQLIANGSTTAVGHLSAGGAGKGQARPNIPVLSGVGATAAVNWGGAATADQGQTLALAESACESTFDQMTDAAKQKAVDWLNGQLNLTPPLTLASSWDDIAKATSSAVGALGGNALGSMIGGPIGGEIGDLCGAYLGVKIEDFLSKGYDDAKAWVNQQWPYVEAWIDSHGGSEIAAAADWLYAQGASVEGVVQGAASSVEDAVTSIGNDAQDALNYVGGLF